MATCFLQFPFSSKKKYSDYLRLNKANTWSYLRHMQVPPSLGLLFNIFNCVFCPVQLQIAIFDFKEEETATEHVSTIDRDILNCVTQPFKMLLMKCDNKISYYNA